MLYFAYGSKLDPEQMKQRCPDHKVVGLASLHDHRLWFPRTSHAWGGGVASIQLAHGTELWGIVYELSEADMAALDQYEGWQGPDDQHNVYDRELMFVELTRPDDGSFPRRLRPWVYVARPSNPAPPSRRYLDAMLAGARHHGLPEDHIVVLEQTETVD